MENFNYYFISRKGDQAYPLIKSVKSDKDEKFFTKFMYLEFNTPIPRNPVMADFLSGADVFLTKRIVEEIKKFQPEGVVFLPTELTDPKGNVFDDYIVVVPRENSYEALDKEKSQYEYEYGTYWIDKIVLDRKALNEISIKKRLIFRLKEAPGYVLFHESLVEAISKLNPTGMIFRNVEKHEGF